MEHSIGNELFKKSDIVKNPEWFYKPELLDFDIDYIILPFRSLMSVAKSRDRNSGYGGFHRGAYDIPGQIKVDASALCYFIECMVLKDLKVIFLDFPRIVKDPEYLYLKVVEDFIIESDLNDFKEVFNQIAKPGKVHI